MIEKLGFGGFAEVFRGRDQNLDRDVAIKRILKKHMNTEATGRILRRFKNEAKSIAKLKHENIVEIYDYDNDDKGYYIVMEYIRDGTLKEYLSKKKIMPPKQAVGLVKKIGHALQYAHMKNLIHRDIKPDNIMINYDDGKMVPKIVDFGLARVSYGPDESVSGKAMGTPGYMAPEQRKDAKNVDQRADIYALGKVLYNLLTGTNPADVIPSFVPEPARLVEIIFKCIDPNPQDRYASMEELITELDKVYPDGQGDAEIYDDESAAQAACPQCQEVNPGGTKFCAKCGASLYISCPECGRENKASSVDCLGCETHIVQFNEMTAALETVKKLALTRDWQNILNTCETLPKAPYFPGPKGKNLYAELHEACTRAKANVVDVSALRDQLKSAMAAGDRKDAIAIADKILATRPAEDDVLQIRTELKLCRLAEVFDKGFAKLRFLKVEHRCDPARSVVEDLKKAINAFEQPAGFQWPTDWQERFAELQQFDEELNADEGNLKQLEIEAQAALERKDFKACIDLCNHGLTISENAKQFLTLKHQASMGSIENEYHQKDQIIEEKRNQKLEEFREIESELTEAWESQNFEACLALCDELETFSMVSGKCEEIQHKASHYLKQIEQNLDTANFFYDKKDWLKVIEVCDDILRIKPGHKRAQELLDSATFQFGRSNKIRKSAVAISLIGVVAVIGVILLGAKVFDLRTHKNARIQHQNVISAVDDLYTTAREQAAVDGTAAIELLNQARYRLETAASSEFVKHLDTSEKKELETLATRIVELKKGIVNARSAHQTRYRLALNTLQSAERLTSTRVEETCKLYLLAFEQLSAVQDETVMTFLENSQKIDISNLRRRIENSCRQRIFGDVVNAKLHAERVNAESEPAFELADQKLTAARTVFNDSDFQAAADLAIAADKGFHEAADTVMKRNEFNAMRGGFLERINRIDYSRLKNLAPEKAIQIDKARRAANKALNNNDYDLATLHFKTATTLLEIAEDFLAKHISAKSAESAD